MKNKPDTSLTQYSQPLVIKWDGTNSKKFNARGARGLLIYIPDGWVTATLDFYGIISGQPVPVADDNGTDLRIGGIDTSKAKLYIAPPAIWGVGALESIQLFSRNTGDTAFVPQTIDNIIVYPLR